MLSGDAEFQAVGDAVGALDEVLGRGRRTDLVRGVLEQREPAVEVARIDREWQKQDPKMVGSDASLRAASATIAAFAIVAFVFGLKYLQ